MSTSLESFLLVTNVIMSLVHCDVHYLTIHLVIMDYMHIELYLIEKPEMYREGLPECCILCDPYRVPLLVLHVILVVSANL